MDGLAHLLAVDEVGGGLASAANVLLLLPGRVQLLDAHVLVDLVGGDVALRSRVEHHLGPGRLRGLQLRLEMVHHLQTGRRRRCRRRCRGRFMRGGLVGRLHIDLHLFELRVRERRGEYGGGERRAARFGGRIVVQSDRLNHHEIAPVDLLGC